MKKKITSWIRNRPLRSKIIFVTFTAMGIMVGVTFLSLFITVSSTNSLLYKAIAGALNHTAQNISTKLSAVEAMSNTIVTNADIRRNLITLLDDENTVRRKNAKNSLERQLTEYQQTYKGNNISYINLYSNDICVTSYEPAASQTPEHIHTNLITQAKNNAGYPVWNTYYCNTHGLFLGREARQVQNLSFRTLGTVVVCVDMNKLISADTSSILLSDDIYFALLEDGDVFYHSHELSQKQASQAVRALTADYQVLTVDGVSYFAVQGAVSTNDWTYICLIPYDDIARTIRATQILIVVIILLAILLVVALTNYFAGRTVSGLSLLANKMVAFSQDNSMTFEPDDSYRNRRDEIGILHCQFDDMVLKIQALVRENYIGELLTRDAQLKALENQINPHFLYNTLETVNWRAKAVGESEISLIIESLGKLLRETIGKHEQVCSLEHELEITADYIAIQKIRYGDRLEYCEHVPEELLNIQLPHLTIQPLVENAIFYALDESIEPCRIEVTAWKENAFYIVSVKNNGSSFEENILEKMMCEEIIPHGFGVGILNIIKRIQIIFGPEYGLELCSPEEDIAVVNIRLPGGESDA